MKICQNCGHENGDNTNFCSSCGSNLQNLAPTQTNINQSTVTYQQQNDVNTYQQPNSPTNQSQDYQQTNAQQQYNNQQNTYSTSNYPVRTQKNAWIAIILDVIGGLIFYFLTGIGQLYLGLYKRGIVLCVLDVVVTIINVIILLIMNPAVGNIITLIIGIALVVYSAYDAYICTNAINEGRTIPLLFGALDLQ